MSIQRASLLYKILRTFEIIWFSFDGYTPDLEQIDWIFYERPLFSTQGLIKINISLFWFRDIRLKMIAHQYGGWNFITSEDFVPSADLYAKLEHIGFAREEFDRTRRYLADPAAYREWARKMRNYEF